MKPSHTDRTCRFEQMEPRQMLAADLASAPIPLSPTIESEVVQTTPGSSPSSLGGRVHFSTDSACQNSTDVAGLSDVTLRLLGETGNVLAETQTDAEGNYRFANLSPGIYAVHEVQPPGIRDRGAHIGSGGGMVLDNNLLGEIVVHAGSDLVDYNFCERPADELSETGGEEGPSLIKHSGGGLQGDEALLVDAALWLVTSSSSTPSPQPSLPLESPATAATTSNHQPSLLVARNTAAPFFGSSAHAKAKPITGDWNGDGAETLATFHEGLWQLDLDGDGKFTDEDREVRFGEAGDVPVVGDWNDDGIDDLGVLREGLWILDHQGNQELDAEDYDRAFELSEAEAVGARL